MFKGMERKVLLKGKNSVLSLVEDSETNTYSIAISDGYKPNFKFISKELHDLLIKELEDKEYF